MPVDVSEVMALAAALGTAGSSGQRASETTVQSTVAAMAATARSMAPVLTGTLRGSITSSGSGLTGTVEATARYAPYVEYGTSRTAPQPFMNPAADQHETRLPDQLDAAVSAAVEAALG